MLTQCFSNQGSKKQFSESQPPLKKQEQETPECIIIVRITVWTECLRQGGVFLGSSVNLSLTLASLLEGSKAASNARRDGHTVGAQTVVADIFLQKQEKIFCLFHCTVGGSVPFLHGETEAQRKKRLSQGHFATLSCEPWPDHCQRTTRPPSRICRRQDSGQRLVGRCLWGWATLG